MPQLNHWSHWLAFGLGSGLAPKAPGTFGSLAALPVWWLLLAQLEPVAFLIVIAVTFAVGIYFCDKTAADLGVHDHPGIVWDEWVGMWLTLFMVPAGIIWVLIGFALFRFFDIVKPWPIKWLDQKVKGGFGIMVDDLLAGLMALLVLQLLAYIFI
ncbi:MAG: phosphatidylglycerophosphatase A [Oceanobacter sp.]